jgi:hypothetical protein
MTATSFVLDSTDLSTSLTRALDDARGDPAALARLHQCITQCRSELAIAADEAVLAFHDAVGRGGSALVEGVGLVEATWSASRSAWRNEQLVQELARLAETQRAVNTSTGEVESRAEAALRALISCARPSWRVGALRQWGVAVDEFCETRWRKALRIR